MRSSLTLQLEKAIINDLAIQFYVCKQIFGSRLRSFNLVLRVDNDSWNISDRTEELGQKTQEARSKISEYREVLESHEPKIEMGSHCYAPYKCEFIDYCEKVKH